MPFTLNPLPYPKDALMPHISATTFEFHHGKHHQAYVNNLNKLIEGAPQANASLVEIIQDSVGDPAKAGLFNNSAQVWNHDFFWASMKPQGGGQPTGEIGAMITASFGDYQGFSEAFSQAATTQFGSGWAWLVAKGGKLEIRKTPNAETPLTEAGATPLLTLDVWEHAYYLDYQNRRPDFIKTFLDHLINWDFANGNLRAA